MDPIYLDSVRGGLNNEDPPTSIGANQLTVADNIDLDRATLAGRRGGHSAVTLTGALNTKVPFLYRHLPNNALADAELWAISTSGTSSVWARKTTAWSVVTPTGTLALDVAEGQYAVRAASHYGKMFICYPTASGVDRMHVWDGSSIRVTGLAEPAAPSVSGTGSGSFETLRYYRVRYTTQVGGVTTRRSEPSDSTSFSPSIISPPSAARVTKPAAINEGETHWEIEESLNNTDFYLIATVIVATTTYDDSLTPAEVPGGTLSPDIGDFTLQWSAKFVLVDEDRVLIGGSWEQSNLGSRIGWTPVGLAPGIAPEGNDERIEADTDPYLDLDNKDGGELTDFQGPLFGYLYAFKYQRIYKLVRTKNRQRSYEAVPITSDYGAIPGTVCAGKDQFGRPCLYFVDPYNGPCRIGINGLERCGYDVMGTWRTVNRNATVVARTVYYPDAEQVWFYLATGSSMFPDTKIKLHTRYVQAAQEGLRGGWSIDTGTFMGALTTCLFSTNIEANTTRNLNLKPFVGISGSPLVAMADDDTTDNGTGYTSRWRTGVFAPFKFVQKFRVRAGTFVGDPIVSGDLIVSLIRDVGRETVTKVVTLTPDAVGQTKVIKPMDNLALSELFGLQVEIGDSDSDDWVADSLSLFLEPEESI